MSKVLKLTTAKPFLRWAGGKTWLLKHLKDLIGSRLFSGYHEPFLGGGAVFFSLPYHARVHLSDINPRLIDAYKQVRDNVEDVIDCLKSFENTREFYNSTRGKIFQLESFSAAQFIYLNQTSFNGIYRENLKGQYNVPYGNRTKNFIQEDVLRDASKKLSGCYLRCHEFDRHLNFIKKGDLVFLDPPYTITHNNNGFIKYNKSLFCLDDQIRLSEFIDNITNKGAYYILTNAAHADIKKIFSADIPRELSRVSHVGGKAISREEYSEYLFTNL